MRYLELVEAVAIIDEMRLHVKDLTLIHSALGRPAASMFGVEQYPDLLDKAAALLHSLVNNHPMVDGNKRVAWVLTSTFLQLNGCTYLNPDPVQVYEFLVTEVAGNDSIGIPEISVQLAEWFQTPPVLNRRGRPASAQPTPPAPPR